MDSETFRRSAHELVDRMADCLRDDSLRRIPVDAACALRPDALDRAIRGTAAALPAAGA